MSGFGSSILAPLGVFCLFLLLVGFKSVPLIPPLFHGLFSSSALLLGYMERLQAIEAETAEISRNLKNARQASSRHHHREERAGYTNLQVQVAIAVYVLTDLTSSAACYLQQQGTGQRNDAEPTQHATDALIDLVLTWYLEADLAEITAVHYPENDAHRRVRAAAEKFLVELAVVSDIRAANAKGVAPASADVEVAYSLKAEAKDVPARAGTSSRAKLKWVARFRERWALRRGKLTAKPPLTDEDLRGKVWDSGCHPQNFVRCVCW